ncbi:MAG: glutamate formimidoyltransferase [Elusimicrobia bacterium]|nr:glutamate formimidoyltransferase [Elusimicrobiota bacterium]
MKLVECVPNFSEGRDKAKIEAIVSAAKGVAGVRVLDVESDPDHHRCVLSYVAPPEAALEAAFRAAAKARELIDLTRHQGEHPRMGAVDVIPFIPVAGTDIKECVALARKLAERIGRELEIPVFLYGLAAAKPERLDLAQVRKGQFEGLRTAIGTDPSRDPDFGPRRIHPTAGAVAVGAREQIINFNVNLDLKNAEEGKAIAKKIRTSGGGLPALRAKEIVLSSGFIQISTVLTDYRTTGIRKVLDAILTEARARGADLVSTEIIGLIPRAALVDHSVDILRVVNFDPKAQVLEERLDQLGGDWREAGAKLAEALASTDPTPGGGSAACAAGAMGCGLGEMAAGISLGSKKLDLSRKPALEALRSRFGGARSRLVELAGEDAASFDRVMAAMKLPKEDPARPAAIQKALEGAAQVPLETARLAAKAFADAREAAPLCTPHVASDAACAAHLLTAAVRCAVENVRINTSALKDRAVAKRLDEEADELIARVRS